MPFSGFYVLIINILQSVHPPKKHLLFQGGVHSSLLFDFQYVTPKIMAKCTPPSQNSREKNSEHGKHERNEKLVFDFRKYGIAWKATPLVTPYI